MSTGAALRAVFRAEFGREPHGQWAAPGRVNLIGEHVDYAGGLCLPLPLPQRTVVAAAARDDGLLRLRSQHPGSPPWNGSVTAMRPGHPPGWAGYPAGVVWALRAAGHPVPGLDLLVGDSVPPGAGLASSAALECAVALAVDALAELGLARTGTGRSMLATACRRAENEIVGAPTGGMDQIAVLRCTPGHAVLLDCRDGTVRHLPLQPAAEGLALLVIDTRAPHRLTEGRYAQRRRSVEQAAAALGVPSLREADVSGVNGLADPLLRSRARHVISEIARVRSVVTLLERGRPREIGGLMDASHDSLRDDFEVSSPELDCAVDAARAAGALGARMTGGGFGGSILALVPQAIGRAVAEAVRIAAARHHHPEPALVSTIE
ncbi:MAG TPA: galactokinase [Pseudonocardiaceae bacterium]|jgi:galactokinase